MQYCHSLLTIINYIVTYIFSDLKEITIQIKDQPRLYMYT